MYLVCMLYSMCMLLLLLSMRHRTYNNRNKNDGRETRQDGKSIGYKLVVRNRERERVTAD